MENIRIAVLDQNDTVLTFFDNSTNSSPRYFEDELHEYIQGAASTFSFSVLSDNDDANHLVVGHKIAFTYDDRDFYLNIMSTERDETIVIVEAYSLSFELLNEKVDAYTAPSAKTFSQYLSIFDPEGTLVVGTNEVSDKSLTCEWTEETTILNRLFSLANKFSSEIEFVTCLNDDHSLKQITINAYKEHSDSYQGIGKDRRDLVLRYGQNISGIRKKSDVTDLYTCIKLTGKDGLTISSLDKTEYDSSGNIEYRSPNNDSYIRAVQARDRFPSNLMNKNDRYIARYGTYETDNVNVLYGQALALLKKNCTPLVEYEVDGYIDTSIGDTVSIEDSEYKPTLYLEARVSERVRSFTEPSKNKTTFSNFVEKQSQISPELLSRMQAMIDAKKSYTCSIITDNGIVFKNGVGSTTLTASMMDVGNDVTDNFTITWYKDGVSVGTDKTLTVQASDIVEKAVYKFEGASTDGTVHGFYEVTISNVKDGTQGIPGAVGEDGKTSYIHIAYANDETGTIGFSLTDSSGKLYIGQYTDFTQPDSSNPAKYKWIKVKGDDGDPGEPGIQGPPGDDGQTNYTWLKYADTPTSGMSEDPTGKAYMGLAYNRPVQTESNNYEDYTWSLIKGGTGAPGPTGYTWVKYATSATGENMSDDPSGKTYIGLAYNKTTQTDVWLDSSNNTIQDSSGNIISDGDASDYIWALIKGDKGDKGDTGDRGPQGVQGLQGYKGDQGVQGPKGADGTSTYFHIAYANNATGTLDFSVSDSTNKLYIGTYVDSTPTDSTTPSKYSWQLVKGSQGAQGEQGIPGTNGANGKTSYLHIAYATNATGTAGFSTTDSVGKTYIGQYTDFTATDSTAPSAYAWTLIKGDTGATGPKGDKGDTGATGGTGATGNGIASIEAQYYLSTSKTTQTGGSWGTVMPAWSEGKYLWIRNKITYTSGETVYTQPYCDTGWEAAVVVDGKLTQTKTELLSTMSQNYATKGELQTVDGKFTSYTTTVDMNSIINQKVNEITLSVSQNYATKTALATTDCKFADYSTTTQMNTAIQLKANEINQTVSQNYTTKGETGNIDTRLQSAESKLTPSGLTIAISEAINAGSANKINTVNFVLDMNGVLIKNGGLTIQNNAGVTVLSADVAGNLTFTGALNGATGTFRGALTAYNSSGKLLMLASAGRINFYDGANDVVTGYVDSDMTANTNNIRINGNGLITLSISGTQVVGIAQNRCNIYKPILYQGALVTMPRIYAGTTVCDAGGGNSVQIISLSQINSLFGINNASAANTAVFVSNGDGTASNAHCQDATFLGGEWWATFDRTGVTTIRINYLVVCWA